MRSPNIWEHPATYEIENRAADPDGLIEAAMAAIAPWDGRDLLDLGCGTGFHLPRWAESGHGAARSVVGVEPHAGLVAIARRRVRALSAVTVVQGSATALPLAPASVDVVHVRWAYFFGPGCEPGLRELDRVVRRGGTAFVVDNDPTRSTFGTWFRRGYPDIDPDVVEPFWLSRGWQRERLTIRWEFDSRADLEAVVGIEFDPTTAAWILAHHQGTGVDYAVNLWWRHF
ncbi:class I SAM-dependent methyltransferase [Nocardioides mangrovicus]|uniref:class I SAM-dependent methyltransferase n=1 Tax=Nocardioides mangrovicus TaxID=2478913 RepID=UPI001E5F7ECE|nr:class I SAM-dependent methyltransferase [Nocardioides mangrovicus]